MERAVIERTRFTVRTTIGSLRPGAIVVESNGGRLALDGVTPEMLIGLARMIERSAELLREENLGEEHGVTDVSISYDIEWSDDTRPVPESMLDD